MRIGYGVIGGDTAIQTTRRRWLILLLAFLFFGAALVLVATSPSLVAPVQAAQEVCPAEGPDGGKVDGGGGTVYDAGWEVCVKAGKNLVEALVADGESTLEELLRARKPPIKQDVSHHTVILIRNPPVIESISAPAQAETDEIIEVSVSYTDLDLPGDSHSCTFDWGDGPPATVVVVDPATSPCSASHSYPDPDVYTVTVTVTDDFGLTDSATTTIEVIGFDVSCEGEGEVTCDIGLGENFTGFITCDEFCGVNVNFGGDEVEVVSSNPFMIIYESVGKGTNPGDASVEVEKEGQDPFFLQSCGKNGTDPTTDCVHINRVHGNHTQYIVFFTTDPNFKFR